VAEPSHSVFVSYASQDVEAAQAICKALRAAGVEVFIDQSELRGGDAWDKKIRHEIRECALFVPIISSHTQSRLEGYFRHEWSLAVERTHRIAEQKAFLVPVVIDDTSNREAFVPDAFRQLQWTRLPGGKTSSEFVTRIQKLLSGEATPVPTAVRGSAVTPRRTLRTATLVLTAVVLGALVAFTLIKKPWSATESTPGAFTPPQHSIAVLPFVNMSGDKEQEYFSDGLTEELLNSLSRVNELEVAARTSAFSFKGKDTDIGTIARKLNVGTVLEGSVRRSGRSVRITAELINAVTGFHMWSQTYDRTLDDVFTVQTDIANAVAGALKVTLLGAIAAKIELGGTRSPAAFDAFLRARMTARSTHDAQAAIAAFSEAIRLDPNYALPYAWRSLMYSNNPVQENLAKQEADAREAIRLAPDLAEGYAALGRFFAISLDLARADENIERALQLAPGSSSVQEISSIQLTKMGRFDAGVSAAKRAVVLDPLNDNSREVLGWALYSARRYREAVATYRDALSIAPGWPEPYADLGHTYYMMGDHANAMTWCEKKPDAPQSRLCLAIVYNKLGRQADADSMLAKLKADGGDDNAYWYAAIYTQWGKPAQALEWLEKAFRLRDPGLTELKVDPLMDPLRKEPRFQSILAELKIPD
jgi:TolB-like protein/tetratricopeptide (TPR) repeat protein